MNKVQNTKTDPIIVLRVSKFKELLIHSWHLLPPEKQQELLSLGIYPKA